MASPFTCKKRCERSSGVNSFRFDAKEVEATSVAKEIAVKLPVQSPFSFKATSLFSGVIWLNKGFLSSIKEFTITFVFSCEPQLWVVTVDGK